jgi:RNA polymerase sigma factor, sigma-70 family/RNA polymerase sigma-70 factor, sigma-B/F/G subfamily
MNTAAAPKQRSADNPELFARWQQGQDPRARDELAAKYLPLAQSLARRYRRSSEPFEDLVQVASLGLIKAIDRFDPSRGLAFSSFAVPTILGELKRYFRDSGWAVHVPRGTQERARRVEDAARLITARDGRAPTISELAQFLEITQEDVLDGIEAGQAYATVSLDAPRPTDEDGSETYVDTIGDEDHRLAIADELVTTEMAVSQLDARDRRILYLRFVSDLTQTEIAEQIGVSQMQVSRLLRKSLARLRELADG